MKVQSYQLFRPANTQRKMQLPRQGVAADTLRGHLKMAMKVARILTWIMYHFYIVALVIILAVTLPTLIGVVFCELTGRPGF
jgi:hypothetical protein